MSKFFGCPCGFINFLYWIHRSRNGDSKLVPTYQATRYHKQKTMMQIFKILKPKITTKYRTSPPEVVLTVVWAPTVRTLWTAWRQQSSTFACTCLCNLVGYLTTLPIAKTLHRQQNDYWTVNWKECDLIWSTYYPEISLRKPTKNLDQYQCYGGHNMFIFVKITKFFCEVWRSEYL